MEMTAKEQFKQINEFIRGKGFTYDPGLIENFWLSLKSKPFVILAGISGTGKTQLVRLFAEAIGAKYRLACNKLFRRSLIGDIRFPENFYLVGTVNMDETTFPFSKKVLDRANTIEFSTVNLMPPSWTAAAETEPIEVGNEFLKSEYLFLNRCLNEENREFIESVCRELEAINQILKINDAHVGYRVRDEIVFYMLNNRKAELLSREEALDNVIMQKIMPRIQGRSVGVKQMLCELFKFFAGDYEEIRTQNNDAAPKMSEFLKQNDVKYPKSAAKTAFMVKRFEEDGFTSYWI